MTEDPQTVYAVTSYDLGGNSGYVIQGLFTTREAAETFVGADTDSYEIEEYPLWTTAPDSYIYWHRGAHVYPDGTVEAWCKKHTAKGPPSIPPVDDHLKPFDGHMQGHCGLHISIFGTDRDGVEQAYLVMVERARSQSTGVCSGPFNKCGRTENWKRDFWD